MLLLVKQITGQKNNRSNREQWHKWCWNNGNIKLSNSVLENSSNTFNELWKLPWSKLAKKTRYGVADQDATFLTTDTKLYVPVVTLST